MNIPTSGVSASWLESKGGDSDGMTRESAKLSLVRLTVAGDFS